jgi:CheY-like chemotaxis protein
MGPLSILVVDDDAPTQRVLQLWLQLHGHDVSCAGGGHEALGVLDSRHVDLVITDVLMPDGDGIELIVRLKQRQPHLRVLAVSGGGPHLASTTCLERAHAAGAHALLLKPFKQDQLLHAMRYVIGAEHLKPDGLTQPLQPPPKARLFAGMAEPSAPVSRRSRGE